MNLLVDIVFGLIAFYLILGILFSIYFYTKGGAKVDSGTQGAPWHFKAIIFPGVVVFWIILLIKIIRSK